jgi:hypothetical protein
VHQLITGIVSASRCFGPVALLFITTTVATAQPVYPVPRLATVTPPGAKTGSTVEVTLSGADLDEVKELVFSDARIKAARLPDPPPPKDDKAKKKTPPPAPLRFKVDVPAAVPPGAYDVRAIGKWGVSNPRVFVVGALPEVAEKEPNSDVPQAQPVEIGTVVHGVVNPRPDVDYFRFAGKKGQRVIVHCASWTIDSKLNPQLQLFGPGDRELASNRNYRNRDAVLDCVLPADGAYLIRLCEFTYLSAGPEYFYRLTLSAGPWLDAAYPPVVQAGAANTIRLFGRNLPGSQPNAGRLVDGTSLEEVTAKVDVPASLGEGQLQVQGIHVPRTGMLDGLEYRLAGPAGPSNAVFLARVQHPVILDNGKNDTPETAQAVTAPCEVCGNIEKAGDRDWYAFTAKKGDVLVLEGFADRLRSPIDLLMHVVKKGSDKPLGIFDDHPDVPAVIGKLHLRTSDPKTRLVVPEDGAYQLMVRSHAADLRHGARHIYRVSIRKEQPDFRLILVGNNDVSTGGCTVRRGGSQDLDVVCLRQDGFDGEVTLSVEGLPAGVACPPQVIGPKQTRTALVVTADRKAALSAGPIKVTGVATVNGAKVVREARAACLVWPAPQNAPPISRLARSTYLAVREEGPYALETSVKGELAAPVGGNATVKLQLQSFAADFKTQVQIESISGPAQANGQPINLKLVLAPGKKDADVKINLPGNSLVGTYNVFQVTPPIRMVVYNRVAELTLPDKAVTLKAGAELPVVVRFARLHGYKGDFKLQAVLPQGFSGASAAEATVPANANEGKLVFKAPASAKPSANAQVKIRAIAKVGSASLTSEIPLILNVVDAKTAPLPPGVAYQTVQLVPAGAGGWKHLPAAQVKGEDWLKPEFNDGGWRSAKAPLGYGEDAIAAKGGTTIGEQGQNLCCRRRFEVAPDLLKQPGVVMRLTIASDNSAVVYVNGVKVDEDTGDHEFTYWNRDVTLPATALRPGANTLAVLVNNTSGSSDLFLDAELTAAVPKKK